MSSPPPPPPHLSTSSSSRLSKPTYSRSTTESFGDYHLPLTILTATQKDSLLRDSSTPLSSASSSSPDRSRSNSRHRRPSLGSIKEDVDGIAQSFVDTHLQPPLDDPDYINNNSNIRNNLSQAFSDMQHTPDFCCPCGTFLGWKQIRLGGKSLSKSYNDLRLLGSTTTAAAATTHSNKGWAWDTGPLPSSSLSRPKALEEEETKPFPDTGNAVIERLPPEILDQIISNLALDVPPNGYTPRNVDLISCLLTSRTLHAATLSVLYRNMTFPHSIIFSKALNHISQYPALGTLVRRLDLSHFTSIGLGRTKQMNAEIQNLTPRTLLHCLDLLPNLKECLLQEHVEGDISVDIMRKLFSGLPNLQALDFCGCSSQSFAATFLDSLSQQQQQQQEEKEKGIPLAFLPSLKRLSLHECSGLPASVFEYLLPRLVTLTHLDVTHTQISEAALFSIPETAHITHLSLSRCSRISGPSIVKFLTTHPAVSKSLVYLNLMADPSRYRLLEADDVKALLPRLPSSLRSLNLGGAKITSEHTPGFVPLTKHLEELGLSSTDLSAQDLNAFFAQPQSKSKPRPETEDVHGTKKEQQEEGEDIWVPSTLRYLDLTKVPRLSLATIYNTGTCLLLSERSYPLQVIEFSDKIIAPLRERTKTNRTATGWTVRELGRRGWYVRDPASIPQQPPDDGSRWWKMGARWWGMRKIPVVVGDVGGIYGHYMFKK